MQRKKKNAPETCKSKTVHTSVPHWTDHEAKRKRQHFLEMCQCIISVHCKSFHIFNRRKRLLPVHRWRRVLTGPGCYLRQRTTNMRPVSPQLCVQYASECSWHVKLDKPQDAHLHCKLEPELPKNKIVLAHRTAGVQNAAVSKREQPLETDQSDATAACPSESE